MRLKAGNHFFYHFWSFAILGKHHQWIYSYETGLLEHLRRNFPELHHSEVEVVDDFTTGKRPCILRCGYFTFFQIDHKRTCWTIIREGCERIVFPHALCHVAIKVALKFYVYQARCAI